MVCGRLMWLGCADSEIRRETRSVFGEEGSGLARRPVCVHGRHAELLEAEAAAKGVERRRRTEGGFRRFAVRMQ